MREGEGGKTYLPVARGVAHLPAVLTGGEARVGGGLALLGPTAGGGGGDGSEGDEEESLELHLCCGVWVVFVCIKD